MKKLPTLLYGLFCYTFGVAALVYLIAFLFNLFVPVTIDAGVTTGTWPAVMINLALISLFGLQHSVMARPRFKDWLNRYIPSAAERSTYLLATGIVIFAMCLLWQPMPTVIWHLEEPTTYYMVLALGLAGWGLTLYSTFLIDHFDLFGLRQTWLFMRDMPYTERPFVERQLYRYIRHPIMTGALIGIWITPLMTLGHALFAVAMTIYILIGVYHEEKDLITNFGHRYDEYVSRTGKFLPRIGVRPGLTSQAG